MVYDIGFYYGKYYQDSTPEYTRFYGTSWTVEHIRFIDVPYWYARGYLRDSSTGKYALWITQNLIVNNPDTPPDIVSIEYQPDNYSGRIARWWLGDGVTATYSSKELRPYTFSQLDNPPSKFDPFRVTYSHRGISAIGQQTTTAHHYFLPSEKPIEYKFINPVFLEYVPVGGYSEYEFKIYDRDSIVYQTIETERPSFNIKSICPDNTCPVDCGTHICCYGSDGIATEYFTK